MSTKTKLTPAEKLLEQEAATLSGSTYNATTATGLPLSSSVPDVSSTEAGDVVPFTLPNQQPDFTPTAGLTTKSTSGGTQMTLSDFVEEIHKLQGDKVALTNIQTQLHANGLLPKNWASYGTLDSATIKAWKQLGTDAVGSSISATTLLASGTNYPNLVADMQAVQSAKDTALKNAAQLTNSNVTLTDPNEVGQKFATAMESMGMGAPSKALVDKFVSQFHSAEVAATVDQVNASKQNYMASADGNATQELNDLKAGNLSAAQQAAATVGPTTVATKAAPNLDAEAIAAAQAQNPAAYYANDMTYGYSLLQKMLGGDLSLPSTPTSPTAQTTSGDIVSQPMANI